MENKHLYPSFSIVSLVSRLSEILFMIGPVKQFQSEPAIFRNSCLFYLNISTCTFIEIFFVYWAILFHNTFQIVVLELEKKIRCAAFTK